MAKTRTYKEVERDFRQIKKYVDRNSNVRSIKEIARALGLSVSQVKTSLSRHERVQKDICELIERNLKLSREKKATSKPSMSNEKNETEISESETTCPSRYVIDASITGVENLFEIMNGISSSNGTFVLTSITIKELDSLTHFEDSNARDARRILRLAVENEEGFECVGIDETLESSDDCIIKYCADNKDEVVLVTSDKSMALKARAFGVKTRFLMQSTCPKEEKDKKGSNYKKRFTLYVARKLGTELVVDRFEGAFKKVRIYSHGVEYNAGTIHLKVGDDVFVATKKDNYLTFGHYKMTSLDPKYNCILVHGARIYNPEEIEDMPKKVYRVFMKAFMQTLHEES